MMALLLIGYHGRAFVPPRSIDRILNCLPPLHAPARLSTRLVAACNKHTTVEMVVASMATTPLSQESLLLLRLARISIAAVDSIGTQLWSLSTPWNCSFFFPDQNG